MRELLRRLFGDIECEWCAGETRNVADYTSSDGDKSLQIQIYEKQIQIGLDGIIVAGLDIEHCPMCGNKIKEKEGRLRTWQKIGKEQYGK